MAHISGRLTRKELNKNLEQQMQQRSLANSQRHVTHHQVYMALHDLVYELDSDVTVPQIQLYLVKIDSSLNDLSTEELSNEIIQALTEGIVCNWCRCVRSGYFKPTSEPPRKTEADKIKEKLVQNEKEEENENGYVPPKNLVIHGEVSNEDEVPGFIVTVDEFVDFMKRVREKVGPLKPSQS